MANRDMKLNVVVSLKDRLTGGLDRLNKTIGRATAAMRKIGAAGAIISAISFMGPLNEAAAFQQQLLDIAGTAGLSGQAAFAFVEKSKAQFENLALEVGQSSSNIATGAGKMVAAGLDVKIVEASLKDVGVAATAANASFDDMASVATSMMLNLKVPAKDVRDSLSALVAAGKLGSFELKDMAREFPKLTSQVAKFGITGRDAVDYIGTSLQIAKKGASDTSTAANNFSNFLSKALAPQTVKNFEKMGVDIQAVMQDAAAKGINPLEAMIKKVQDLTGVSSKDIDAYMQKAKENGLQGADALNYVREQLEKIGAAGKMGELFQDQQVLDFLIPMMANIEEYKSIKQQVAEATGALTDKDFATQMQGLNAQKTVLNEIATQFGREWGFAYGAWLPVINNALATILKTFRALDTALGGNLKKALAFAAGIVVLATGIGALGVAIPFIVAGFSAIGAVIGVILSPIGIIIGLLAGAGVLIWKNWDKIAPKLKAFWNGLKDMGLRAWNGIKSAWNKASPYMLALWGKIKQSAGPAWDYIKEKASTTWASIKTGFNSIDFGDAGAKVMATYDAAMTGLGKAFDFLKEVWAGFAPSLKNITDSLKNGFGALGGTVENIKGIASGLGELAGNIIKWLGFGDGDATGFGKFLGKILGFIGELGGAAFEIAANVLQIITGAIRTLIDLLNGKAPDWRSFFPDWFVKWMDDIVAKFNAMKEFFEWATGANNNANMVPAESILGPATVRPALNEEVEKWYANKLPSEKIMMPSDGLELLKAYARETNPNYNPNGSFADLMKNKYLNDQRAAAGLTPPPPPPQKIELGEQRLDVKVTTEKGLNASVTTTQTKSPSINGGRAVGRN